MNVNLVNDINNSNNNFITNKEKGKLTKNKS